MTEDRLKQAVRDHYAAAARKAAQGDTADSAREGPSGGASCCSDDCCGEPVSLSFYGDTDVAELPEKAVLASMGCGNPTALAELATGEVVLDLGSGGGIDVLLSARRVGPTGKAYGLDMTDEMLELARENQRKAGVDNVEFLKGQIEDVPLPAESVDVIISNCVINLAADKDPVLREAYRVLRPAGRFAVSDIVARTPVPAEVRDNPELWSGCLAGALEDEEYRGKLEAAGFVDVDLEAERTFELPGVGEFMTAFVRARKPAR
jgi:SAM-dependent methyltransferase